MVCHMESITFCYGEWGHKDAYNGGLPNVFKCLMMGPIKMAPSKEIKITLGVYLNK